MFARDVMDPGGKEGGEEIKREETVISVCFNNPIKKRRKERPNSIIHLSVFSYLLISNNEA